MPRNLRMAAWSALALVVFWSADALVYGLFFPEKGFAAAFLIRLAPGETYLQIVAALILLTAFIFGMLLHERHRRDTAALAEARHDIHLRERQLQALNEKLQATNQQLRASLMQLDASNQQLLAEENQLKAMNQELLHNEKSLLETRAHYQRITANVPGIVFQYTRHPDGSMTFPYVSPKCQVMLDMPPEAIRRNPLIYLNIVHPDDLDGLEKSLKVSAEDLSIWNWEGRFVINGRIKWIHGMAQPERLPDGGTLWEGLIIDITDRRQAEQDLRDSRHMLRLVLDSIPVRVFWKDCESRYLGCNRAFADDANLPDPEAIIGRNDHEMVWRDQAEAYRADDRQVISSRSPKLNYEEPQTRRDNSTAWLRTSKIPLLDANGNLLGMLGSYEDITEQRQAQDRIRASLKEKEVLLKEIHHRVKNNLQVISSLLNIQGEYTRDPQARELFTESQSRVRAMAMVHERLYISSDFSNVDFGEYLEKVTGELLQLYRRRDIEVCIEARQVFLSVDRATPCGLLIHELVTNALKYAFIDRDPEAPAARIHIALQDAGGEWRLTVADNGVGLPPDFDIANARTLGLQLVNILTRQINGRLAVHREAGTSFEIFFPKS